MAVRLFVGNLSYATTEADLRTYFGTVAPPSQVVLPVDRETGRPRGFAFVEFLDRANAERRSRSSTVRPFNGRPLAVSEARAREDRGPAGSAVRVRAALRARGPAASARGLRPPFGGAAPVRSGRRVGSAAQPQLRSRREAAARRQRQGQEEGRGQAARSDSRQEHRPLVHAGRRLAGRIVAGRYRRFRDEQADRTGEVSEPDDDKE